MSVRPASLIGLILAGAAVATALICLCDPHMTALYMLDIFTVPILIASLFLTAVLALLRQKTALAPALAANALLLLAAWPQFAPHPVRTDGPALRVVFSNLYFRNAQPEKLADWALAQQADILVTVETTPRLWSRLKPLLTARYPYANQQGEVAIFSRYPFAPSAAPGSHFGVAAIATPLGPLRLIGAHFDHPDSRLRPRHHSFDDQLRRRLDAGDRRSVLLVGDFNSDMSGYMLKAIARDYALTPLPALRGTWPSPLPALLRLNLDNAFSGADWSMSNRHIGPDVGSDHRPIVFDLRRS
jgi:endonuclease/exonuclease/phosphatase (EEP) superfamily protein YafD